ncbi:ADP-dependent NAD(P)H-hydrate dehydratase [Arcanobacterium haemolyticum]
MKARSVTDDEIRQWWPIPGSADHKYTRGVLGVVTGSHRYPGAAILGVGAALACGPGMVRYCGDSPLVVPRFPEVVPVHGRVQAWLVGSGMDESADFSLVSEAIDSGLPVVIDAGALPLVSNRTLHPNAILTPHPGELAEMLRVRGHDVTRVDVEHNPHELAAIVARETGAVVMLTAAADVVVEPNGTTYEQTGAAGWRATAGAGDVLAGIAGGLLALWNARSDHTVSAGWIAAAAAHLHGRAANLASRSDAGVGYPIKASNISDALGETIWRILNPHKVRIHD